MLEQICDLAKEGTVTLLFGAHDEEHNDAVVLQEVLVKGCTYIKRGGVTSFQIAVKPMYRLDLTVWALRRRSVNQVDRWDSATYRRTVFVNGSPAELEITQVGKTEGPRLHVSMTGAGSS